MEPGYHASSSATYVVMTTSHNGCTVFYEVGIYALLISPDGESFRVRVGGQEVSLTILPPVVDLDFIIARRRPLNLTERRVIWTDIETRV